MKTKREPTIELFCNVRTREILQCKLRKCWERWSRQTYRTNKDSPHLRSPRLLWAYTYKFILTILLLAVIIRILGIWHDYPYSFYPDEAHFVKRALSFGSFDFNPHWFHKPALYMYILFFEYGLYFLIGKILGLWNSVSGFAVSYVKNPGPVYLIGRITTILFGVATIGIVYKIGERHFRKGVGIIAALLLSLSLGHITSGQYIKADVPATFFVTLSLLFLLNYCQDAKTKDLVLAAVFAGMGTATKDYPIAMLVPIVFSVIVFNKNITRPFHHTVGRIVTRISMVLVAFWTIYFVCSPYNFLDPLGRKATFGHFFKILEKIDRIFGGPPIERAERFIQQPLEIMKDKTWLLHSVVRYFKTFFATEGMGLPIATIAIIGVGYLLLKLNTKTFVFSLYPLAFAFISLYIYPGYAGVRHQIPLYPFLVIAGAAFVVELVRDTRQYSMLIPALVAVCLLHPFYQTLKHTVELSIKQDTRNAAKTWIEANIPPGTRMLIDENGPQLLMNAAGIQKILNRAKQAGPKGQFTTHFDVYLEYQLMAAKNSIAYDLHEIRIPWWRMEFLKDGMHELDSNYDKDMGNPLRLVGVDKYADYVKNGFEYIVVHSEQYQSFFTKRSKWPERYPAFFRLYEELFKQGNLVKEFSPATGNFSGPVVKIFSLEPQEKFTSLSSPNKADISSSEFRTEYN